MKSQDLKKLNLPAEPGVYFFRKGKEIMYIGKATSLRDRVRSYFASDLIQTRGPGILDMVTTAETVTYEQTDTVLEALILEANLIKKFQPKYNVKEKDNKSFSYMIITDEEFPRIGTIRGRNLQVQKQLDAIPVKIKHTFGPFPSISMLLEGLKILRRIFPYRDLKSINPTHDRFYRQLQLSPEHTTEEARAVYAETIKYIVQFFKGNKKGIINDLKKSMNGHADRLEFEEADIAKRKIFALEHINDVSLMKRDFYENNPVDSFRIESYDIAHIGGTNMVGVMTVIENGTADKSSYRKFKIRSVKEGSSHDLKSIEEVLRRRFTHSEWKFPNMIAIDGGETHYKHARGVLRELGLTKTIELVSVVKDARHKPKGIIGDEKQIKKYKHDILLANSEAHRFAITYHKDLRGRHFLK
jgi:excinuclease UvrABC nuclease subunit